MSVSSLKSEGYSSFLNNAAVPSTPLCFFIISVILNSYIHITGIYAILFSIVFFLLFVITLLFTLYKFKNYFISLKTIIIFIPIIIAVCCLIMVFFKYKIGNLTEEKDLPDYINNTSLVIDEINLKRYSSDVYFHTTGEKTNAIKGIIYYNGIPDFNKDDIIFIHHKIKKIKNGTGSSFNYYLISRGIHYAAGLAENDITIITKNKLSSHAYLQKALLNKIDLIFKEPSSGVIKALLTGNQNYVNKNILIQYRNSGVLHSLSASGLHVAVFAAIPSFLLIPLLRKNIAMSVSLFTVLLYLYITDIPIPLIRAVIMFGLFYLQSLLFRKRNVFNYLMLTCSIILIFSPWEIFSPGFQLSFAATAGILIFYKQYKYSLRSLPDKISGSIAVTMSAQIMTIPIVLFHMNQLNLSGLAANIVVIPLISLIMGTAVFTIIISFVSINSAIASGYMTDLIFKLSALITNFFSELRLNFFVFDITPLLILLLLLSLVPVINNRKSMKLRFYPVIISTLLCVIYMKKYYQNNEDRYVITDQNSKADIIIENNLHVLKLDLKEGVDIEKIVSGIKSKNYDIRIIELSSISNSNLLVSGKILNDYIIDEYRFPLIPDPDIIFRKLIFQLEKDNIIIKFR